MFSPSSTDRSAGPAFGVVFEEEGFDEFAEGASFVVVELAGGFGVDSASMLVGGCERVEAMATAWTGVVDKVEEGVHRQTGHTGGFSL